MVDKKPPPGPAQVINLRQARKNRDRADHAARGDENRARHGQSRTETKLTEARRAKADKDLDGARRDHQDGDSSDS